MGHGIFHFPFPTFHLPLKRTDSRTLSKMTNDKRKMTFGKWNKKAAQSRPACPPLH